MSRLTLILTAVVAALGAAAPAQGAEQFLGVLRTGDAVTFTSQSPTALSSAKKFVGLAADDRVIALGPGFALGTSGTLYTLDVKTLRVRPTRAPKLGLRGNRFTLVVSPDRARVRVLGNAGEDVTVDVPTGNVAQGPGLRLTTGEPTLPAVTALADGRIAGVDHRRRALVLETAPGSSQLTTTPLRARFPAGLDLQEPLSFAAVGSTGYALASLETRPRFQSRFVTVDLDTGETKGESGPFFFRELLALTPLGTVPEDKTPPRTELIAVPKTLSLRALARPGGVRFRVRCSEGCFIIASTAVGGRNNIATGRSHDMPAVLEIALPRLSEKELRLMRLRLGKTAFLRLNVRDWPGNFKVVEKQLKVTR